MSHQREVAGEHVRKTLSRPPPTHTSNTYKSMHTPQTGTSFSLLLARSLPKLCSDLFHFVPYACPVFLITFSLLDSPFVIVQFLPEAKKNQANSKLYSPSFKVYFGWWQTFFHSEISVSVSATKTKRNLVEPARKGAPTWGDYPFPFPPFFLQNNTNRHKWGPDGSSTYRAAI